MPRESKLWCFLLSTIHGRAAWCSLDIKKTPKARGRRSEGGKGEEIGEVVLSHSLLSH